MERVFILFVRKNSVRFRCDLNAVCIDLQMIKNNTFNKPHETFSICKYLKDIYGVFAIEV